jgi:hypothetical protein
MCRAGHGQTRTLYAPYFRRRGIQIVHHDVICCDCARSVRIVKVVKHSQNKHTKLTAILQYMERWDVFLPNHIFLSPQACVFILLIGYILVHLWHFPISVLFLLRNVFKSAKLRPIYCFFE